MAKNQENNIVVIIEDGTKIIIDGVAFIGTVKVDRQTANTLIGTTKAKEALHGDSTNS